MPAVRRLYMTATPRLWEASPESAGADETGGHLVASMDDQSLYGPVLFEFGLTAKLEQASATPPAAYRSRERQLSLALRDGGDTHKRGRS
ncbi:hypothetical protein ACWGBO_29950 [[Kitasatospora] papulosa]